MILYVFITEDEKGVWLLSKNMLFCLCDIINNAGTDVSNVYGTLAYFITFILMVKYGQMFGIITIF